MGKTVAGLRCRHKVEVCIWHSVIVAGNLLPVVAGLAVGIGFVLLMVNKPTLPAYPICSSKPLDHIVKLSRIAVMTPTVLPDGYSFQGGGILIEKRTLSLKYYTESTCGERPKYVIDGVILVSGYDLERYVRENITGAEYMEASQ
jgi:hypothetical protein